MDGWINYSVKAHTINLPNLLILKRIKEELKIRIKHEKKGYVRPAVVNAGQELGKLDASLVDGPAGSQVAAGGQQTDCLRGQRKHSMQHLGPQLKGRGPTEST